MAIARAVMRNIPYQPEDFAPVALLTEQPFLVLVNAALPVRSLANWWRWRGSSRASSTTPRTAPARRTTC